MVNDYDALGLESDGRVAHGVKILVVTFFRDFSSVPRNNNR